MTTRDDYLKYAAECFRLAQQATEAATRVRLLAMAQAWRELGDKAQGDKIQNPPAKTNGERARVSGRDPK